MPAAAFLQGFLPSSSRKRTFCLKFLQVSRLPRIAFPYTHRLINNVLFSPSRFLSLLKKIFNRFLYSLVSPPSYSSVWNSSSNSISGLTIFLTFKASCHVKSVSPFNLFLSVFSATPISCANLYTGIFDFTISARRNLYNLSPHFYR